jgi:hypothetical protein
MYEPARCICLVFERNDSIYMYFCRSEVQLQPVLTFYAISREETEQQHTTVSSPPGAAPSSWSLNRPGNIDEKESLRYGLHSSPDYSIVQLTAQFNANCSPRKRATFVSDFCNRTFGFNTKGLGSSELWFLRATFLLFEPSPLCFIWSIYM